MKLEHSNQCDLLYQIELLAATFFLKILFCEFYFILNLLHQNISNGIKMKSLLIRLLEKI